MINKVEVDSSKSQKPEPKQGCGCSGGAILGVILLVVLLAIVLLIWHSMPKMIVMLMSLRNSESEQLDKPKEPKEEPGLEQIEIVSPGTSPSDEVTGKEEESLTDDINDGVYPDPLAALPPGQCLRLASSDITSSIWQELPSVAQVVRDAEKREQVMDYANAAFFFNEANALIKDAGDNTDNQHKISDYKIIDIYTELRIYENFSEILDISNPVKCDPDQEKYVMTPEMVEAVEDFQKQAGIPITGDLDFSTMQKLVTALPHPSSSDNWPGSSSS